LLLALVASFNSAERASAGAPSAGTPGERAQTLILGGGAYTPVAPLSTVVAGQCEPDSRGHRVQIDGGLGAPGVDSPARSASSAGDGARLAFHRHGRSARSALSIAAREGGVIFGHANDRAGAGCFAAVRTGCNDFRGLYASNV
jgi:hypothetical protein